MNNERIQRLKRFKDSYILLVCFVFAINLVISKIKTMLGSIGATIGIAVALMAPIILINSLIKIEELKLKKQTVKQKGIIRKKLPNEIFCPECGRITNKDAKFCEECGEKIC